jgi:asparagine synthase (glutamine-hydrolysing)
MCGIAGILTFDGDPARLSQARLSAMGAALVHRGPDGDGFFVDRDRHDVGLVHRRLSIIDLEGGKQPIGNEDGTVQVVFNGEIFNYIELREELVSRGHRFATHTDTEVIAHLYEDKGEDFVHDLNGQFAIALWDARHRKLLLIRDRPGILPLYYYASPRELVFDSEIKAILAALDSPPAVNPDALRQVMALWAPLSPETMFRGVMEVEPGQMLVVERGQVSPRQYWRWSLAPEGEALNGRVADRAEELRALLDDATRIRLRADVPVGAYLSGGLDSSVLTGLVSKEAGRRLRTFSIGFEDAAFDESPFQRRMIDFIGADHSQIRCARSDLAANFLDVVRSAETPITRTAPVPMGLLSAHVRASGFKVVLTGEGADEVLGGYDLFKEAKIRAFCARNTRSAWRPLLLKRLYPYLDFTRAQSVSILKSYFGAIDDNPGDPLFSHQTRWTTGAWTEEFLTTEFRRGFGPQSPAARVLERLGPNLEGRGVFHRAQFLESRTLMSGYLLASQGDRMLMAHSVEGRFPYLDHRVIEFANRLDPRLKMHVLNEKYLLKQASQGLIPPEILTRPKQPYRAPDAVAFLGPDSPEYVTDLLGADALKRFGYFDPVKVGHLTRKLSDAVKNGRPISHRDSLTWVTVLSTQAWHRTFQR